MKKSIPAGVVFLVLAVSLIFLPVVSYGQAAKPQGPVRGGVLRSSVTGEASTYDPHFALSFRTQAHSAAVFNGLIKPDPLKEEVSLKNMVPDLAESWELSPDGKTYTFHLRRGVKFHDGKPFTSKDVKHSLDKLRDPKRSVLASLVTAVERVEISDDFTVRVRMSHPYPELLLFLTPPYVAMEPEHLKDVNPKSTDFLVGTGPFKFKRYVPGKVSVYERNPDYFIQGLPYLDGYEVYYLDFGPMVDAFVGGNLDVCGTLRALLDSDVTHVMKVRKYAPEAVVALKPSPASRGLFFSFAHKGPWNDIRVRKAMAMVIDYSDVVVPAFGGPELGPVEGAGLLPFYLPEAFIKEEVAKAYGVDKPLKDRIAEAKRLMKESGYGDGFQMKCIVRGGEQFRVNTGLYLADMWKRHLNIEMSVTPLESAVYFPLQAKGDFDITFDTLEVASGVVGAEYLTRFVTGQPANYGKWSNKDFDMLVEQIMREPNQGKKVEMARRAQAIFYAEMPYLVLGTQAWGTAWRPDLRTGWPAREGVVIQPRYTNFTSIDRIWFEGTAKRWTKAK